MSEGKHCKLRRRRRIRRKEREGEKREKEIGKRKLMSAKDEDSSGKEGDVCSVNEKGAE